MGASTLTNPGYVLDTDKSNGEIDGITFLPGGNDSSSETNAVDELALVILHRSDRFVQRHRGYRLHWGNESDKSERGRKPTR
jgi:hypothetical protein